MDTTERSAPVGFSDLFPILPAFSFVSFVGCMLVLPAFIKTRVLALTTCTVWLALGNLLICINMCVWRDSIRDIPIYSDIVAIIWSVYTPTIYLNLFCFHKFVWNITRPGSSLKIYDNRIKYNRVDIFLTTILPILWVPITLITLQGRYTIVEDFGPFGFSPMSLESVLVGGVPVVVITVASVYFVVLTMTNVWRSRHIEPPKRVMEVGHLRFDRTLPRRKVMKYLAMSTITLVGVVFGCIWVLVPPLQTLTREHPWYTKSDIRGNIRQLPLTYTVTRYELSPITITNHSVFFVSIPVMGVVLFVFFGLGPEAFKTYRNWLQNLLSLLKLPALFNFLQIHALGFCWYNQQAVPVDAEYFIPFELNDIALDPHPLVDSSKASRRSFTQTFLSQSRVKPLSHSAALQSIRPNARSPSTSSEEWRIYRKQPMILEPHSIRQPPAYAHLRSSSKDRQVYMASSSRWIAHHKEPIPAWSTSQTSTSVSPHYNVDFYTTMMWSDNQRTRSATSDSLWVPQIRQSPRYDRLPPPYRPPVNRELTSDPISALF
ncbi:hypothetical protein FRC14_008318 [Serendipita sp. 396]|nr:hypothetical protein FRC14_008318 [Serendipita sp. 396]KAG8776899.1 hypothetical protein FRC15_011653 [Serendipita sp. 397]KAG8792563.1 hypothetical protein FRC16_011355 [Serendipita sp. 398]KAG8816848.1 hypothetical protein FRC18_000800 [Serendipita sp. 400]KAG8860424.1 hypothetical protein FRC20_011618 [Serendipita sp. 405]